jgi:integrase
MSVRRKKDGTLIVDIDYEFPNGHRERIRKVAPIQSVRGAEQYERQLRQALQDGSYGEEEEKKADKPVPTLAQFMPMVKESWAARRLKHSTVTTYHDIYERYLEKPFGRIPVDQIDNAKTQTFIASLHGLSVRRTNNIICVLNGVFHVAVDLGEIATAPCQIKMFKVAKRDMKFFEPTEFEQIVAAAQVIGREAHLLVLLGGEAGLRQGEIIALRWQDLDLLRAVLTVNQAEWHGKVALPKHDKIRRVDLTKRLADALRAYHHLKGERVLYRQVRNQLKTVTPG